MIDDEGDTLLRQNQTDWLVFQISSADLSADRYRGGSLSRVTRQMILVNKHQKRIHELRLMIEDRRPH